MPGPISGPEMEAAPHPWPALSALLLRDGALTVERLDSRRRPGSTVPAAARPARSPATRARGPVRGGADPRRDPRARRALDGGDLRGRRRAGDDDDAPGRHPARPPGTNLARRGAPVTGDRTT